MASQTVNQTTGPLVEPFDSRMLSLDAVTAAFVALSERAPPVNTLGVEQARASLDRTQRMFAHSAAAGHDHQSDDDVTIREVLVPTSQGDTVLVHLVYPTGTKGDSDTGSSSSSTSSTSSDNDDSDEQDVWALSQTPFGSAGMVAPSPWSRSRFVGSLGSSRFAGASGSGWPTGSLSTLGVPDNDGNGLWAPGDLDIGDDDDDDDDDDNIQEARRTTDDDDDDDDDLLPAIVYAHGGGWALGDFETHRRFVSTLAQKAHAVVVFVDYARSPEAVWPTPVVQTIDVLQWIVKHGKEWGIDADRLALAGDSAGGDIVAQVLIALAANKERESEAAPSGGSTGDQVDALIVTSREIDVFIPDGASADDNDFLELLLGALGDDRPLFAGGGDYPGTGADRGDDGPLVRYAPDRTDVLKDETPLLDRIKAQVLLYPVTAVPNQTESYHAFANGPWLTRDAMQWYWRLYQPCPEAMPLYAPDELLALMPPSLVITNAYDILRDEGAAFADRLRGVGVPTVGITYGGAIHDLVMLNALAHTPDAIDATDRTARFLRKHLYDAS